jgi:hypothetical protein
MKLPKIMTASFENSLNLLDVKFSKLNFDSASEKEQYRGTFKSYIWIVILSLFFVIIPNYILMVLNNYILSLSNKELSLPKPEFNFLPPIIFYMCLFIWIILIILGKNITQKFLLIYRGQFHVLVTYIIWLALEVNLSFLNVFYTSLTIFGIFVLFILIGGSGFAIIHSKKRSLEKLLYDIDCPADPIDNFIQKIFKVMKYGWLLLVGIALWKFIFPGTTGVRTDIVGFIGIVAMWIVMDIVVILVEVYLFFPFFLQGYYKYKYPEEYREWEGKSQIEWYGEKYFNKHIKGTDKEEKIND